MDFKNVDLKNANTASSKTSIQAEQKPHKPKGFKIALIALAAFFVLFALVLYLLPHFLPIGTIRSIAKTKAREMAGLDVEFGNLRFGWNGNVVIDDLALAPLAPDGTPGEPLLTVKETRTNIALIPLLSGKAIVNSFTMDGFVLKLRREADGNLNLPDVSKLAVADSSQPSVASRPATAARRTRIPLAAAAVNGAAADNLPPIELHQINLKNGILSYVDLPADLDLDVGLDFLRIDGKTLEDPFHFSGRLIPYPHAINLGDLPFSGHAALLKNGAFNPDGEASLEMDVKALSLHEMAQKFGFGDIVPSAQANGLIKAAYKNRKAAVTIPELRFANAILGIDGGKTLTLPDTMASLNAVFDPKPGTVQLGDLSLTNNLAALRATGRIDGINDIAHGVTPAAALDFSGVADFAGTSQYLSGQGFLPQGLPELDGKSTFVGKASLPPQSGGALAPSLSLDFNDGSVQAVDHGSGLVASLELKGVGLKAAANLAAETTVNAAVNFTGVPASVLLPAFGSQPVNGVLNGGAALDHSPQASRVELRLENAQAAIPPTPWCAAANVRDADARIIADLNNDIVEIHTLKATVNNVLQGGVVSGRFTGLMAGNPSGQADAEISGLMDHVKQFLSPVFPHAAIPTVNGDLRGSLRVRMEGRNAEALLKTEVDNTHLVLNIVPGQSQAEVQTPKATLAVLASLNIDAPGKISINSLEADGENATLRYSDVDGSSFQGQTGKALVKAAGHLDTDNNAGQLTALNLDINGVQLALGQSGQQVASLSSGILRIIAASPDHALILPLEGKGEFNFPNVNLGIDNLLFQFGDEHSNFGNVRGRFAVDGYIGQEKRQLINLRAVSLSATPIAINSRGQFDLGSGALLAEYAARVAPAAMSSLLGYLGLPPALLTDAAVTGTVSYNGSVISSKGSTQGQLRTGGNESNPFELAHDLSAAWNPGDRSLALEIRRLDGNVKTQAGEAVATIKAQQSRLLLSRAASKGLLDIRFNGSAGPTRHLALGIAGLFPNMGSLANTLHATQVGGVYNAWLQVQAKDANTLGVKAGTVWQGAALAMNGAPYLSEAAKISASIEGEYGYQSNQARLSQLLFRSESGLMQADGSAVVQLTADQNHVPTGVAHLETDLKFVMADIRKAAMVLPSIIPTDLGLSGRIDGTLRAGGNANDITIQTGVVRFSNFTAAPSPTLEITIPNGQANFGGNINLHMSSRPLGHPWDILRQLNIMNGQASLTGMHAYGKAVNEFSTTFQLENGLATLRSARVTIGDGSEGSIMLSGTADFNRPDPAVNVRLALQHIPLHEFNSEITDYLQVKSGVLNIPGQNGQSAGIAFAGFDKDQILRTIRLDNFTIGTGRVEMETGPVLNVELDKARMIMKQNTTDNRTRRITFSSITGTFLAAGDGVIHMPQEQPLTLTGEDTADFRAFGSVFANHTMDVRVMIAGKIENLIGFTIPNLIPGLSSTTTNITNRLMASMNESAAKGKYGVQVRGPLVSPDISGISALAGQFIADILKSGLVDGLLGSLGKDLPSGVGGIVGDLLTDPKDALKNLPENLLKSPDGPIKGLEQMFGGEDGDNNPLKGLGQMLGGDGQQQQPQQRGGQQQQQQQYQQQQQRSDNPDPRDVIKGLGQMFGVDNHSGSQQQQQNPQQQQQQRRPRLPFGIH